MRAATLVRSLVLAAVLAGAACGHPEDCPEPCPENAHCSMGSCVPYHDAGDGEDGRADTAADDAGG